MLNYLRKSVEFRQRLGSISAADPHIEQLELLKGLPFYSDWNRETNFTNQAQSSMISSAKQEQSGEINSTGRELFCGINSTRMDFNHANGLPLKDGQPMPLFDYEQMLFNILQQQEQHNPKEKGWYCLAHSVRWLCDICGNENKKIGEIKYYFVSGLS